MRPFALVLVACLVACGADDEPQTSNAAGAPVVDGRLQEAQRALMRGEVGSARALAAKLGSGLDEELLRARLVFVEGDEAGAFRRLEELRVQYPSDDRPYATLAELHAARGRGLDAQTELQRGLAAAGRTPALGRAEGVLLLSRPGGAAEGLVVLQQALADDPALPYVALPLAQAHLLLGRRFLGEGRADVAEVQARQALEFDPTGVEPRELLGDCLAALRRFDDALAIFDELASEGRELTAVRVDLRVKAATAALLTKDRPAAIEHYAAARALGADAQQLGFGSHLLDEAADASIDAGLQLLRRDDGAGAAPHFERAIALMDDHIEAWNYLGHARFRHSDAAGAARAWRHVLRLAGDDVQLPEPVVVHLAKAERRAGELERAIETLESYLRERPDDPWRDEVERLLRVLLAERE
ncbi:MAG: tetratricopeptide repeat protein [Planctomycetota bacterium]